MSQNTVNSVSAMHAFVLKFRNLLFLLKYLILIDVIIVRKVIRIISKGHSAQSEIIGMPDKGI